MSCCVKRELFPEAGTETECSENILYKNEGKIGLQKVEFIVFQAAIKRFGYRRDLTEEHLRSIAPEIKLNVDQMIHNTSSAWHIAYRDRDFAFKNNRHDIQKTILIGWLHCKHYNVNEQLKDLWHIVNNKLEDTVSKEQVVELM